jgi:hypothetical protein
MSYVVAAAQNTGSNSYTITSVIQLMGSTHPPANIAFPNLGPGGTNLITGQSAPITLGGAPPIVRSIGLVSCASACFVNGANGHGYVYHANVGAISNAAFNNAMHAIGAPPYANVYVALAHPNASDAGYQQSVTDMIAWGIPTNNIVEITNLSLNMFGLNDSLQIGY